MVETVWFASIKSSIEPLEPKPAPMNSTSCATNKDLLLSLKQIAKYILMAQDIRSISNMTLNVNLKTKIMISFFALDKSDDLEFLENSSGGLTTDFIYKLILRNITLG